MSHVAGPRLPITPVESQPQGGITDTIRALYTYTIAAMVIAGGGVMLYLTRNEANVEDLRIIGAGFIGSAMTFVFGQEVQTRTARQAATATAASHAAQVATVAAANSGVGPEVTEGTTNPREGVDIP